jgi:NADP-dependent 3-hydroxy acid dehydrogenase YdfG
MFVRRLTQELAPSMVFALPPLNPTVATNLMDTITDEDILGKLSEMQKMTMLEPEDIAEAICML